MNNDIPPRLAVVLTPDVMNFAESARTHYQTDDLVVILDLSEREAELQAVTRSSMAQSPAISPGMRAKLSRPAAEVAVQLRAPRASFWFFVMYSDDEMDCAAVNASMLAPGGTA
jgi:hypothetical protein